LTMKTTKSKGKTYRYYYVQHYLKGNRTRWCYLGSYNDLPEEYRELISGDPNTQTNTQNITQTNSPDLNSFSENRAGPVGFEPTTSDLGGLRPILAGQRAPRHNASTDF
jgi:hypothetical protein